MTSEQRRRDFPILREPPTTVGKRFTFDAAHQLPLHDGKCRNLHGHTYRVEVTASGTLIDEGSKSGMVIDFGDIKQVWDEHIKPVVDHQYLNTTLPVEHTTAELIARWMVEQFRYHLGGYLGLTVTVWETPDSWARAS
jgi:6-pyruvoyltetrahydropterin/6-carboxytetrahydropterin synthase